MPASKAIDARPATRRVDDVVLGLDVRLHRVLQGRASTYVWMARRKEQHGRSRSEQVNYLADLVRPLPRSISIEDGMSPRTTWSRLGRS
jgi:hypothetical protein